MTTPADALHQLLTTHQRVEHSLTYTLHDGRTLRAPDTCSYCYTLWPCRPIQDLYESTRDHI